MVILFLEFDQGTVESRDSINVSVIVAFLHLAPHFNIAVHFLNLLESDSVCLVSYFYSLCFCVYCDYIS